MLGAGTSGGLDPFVILIGTKRCSEKVSLLGTLDMLLKGIQADTFEDLVFTAEKDLGDVQVVIVGIDGGGVALNSTWFVSFMEIYDLSKGTHGVKFPCYHWIKADEYVSTTCKTGKEIVKSHHHSKSTIFLSLVESLMHSLTSFIHSHSQQDCWRPDPRARKIRSA